MTKKEQPMTGKMNWTKARKFREIEEKYKPGAVLDNGRTISDKPRDGLDERARKVEQEWLKQNKLGPNLKGRR
jgi:hypothetical protein